MDLTRTKLEGGRARPELRAGGLRARDMLRGDLEGDEFERRVEERVLTTTLEKATAWARGNAISPLPSGWPAARSR